MDITNNQAQVTGTIMDEFRFNHEIYAEKFYTFTLNIPRLSGTDDSVRIMVSERLLAGESFGVGDVVDIEGQFRSYNSYEPSGENRLVLTIFAKDIQKNNGEHSHNPNMLYLNGFICKAPVYRTTPFGREITDLLIAVNRSYNKSDYIPVIAWGRNARYAKTLNVGDNVKVWGRIQSRNYQKRINDEETITKTAYEVSVNRMELIDDNHGNEHDNEHKDEVNV
ncbi:MAG: single-stranded DNA-binding protein [Clostridiales bacterium]|nr:single-stranded DNA-binding protein [Clostridiales bacterium]